MSTIKSSDEHLTLNADGSSKDIKLQSNASEKVIIKSDGKVGIGTSSPSVNVHIVDDATEGTPTFAGATHFAVQATASSSDNVNAALISGSAGTSRIMFGDKDDEDEGKIEYSNSTNAMAFTAYGSERMRIDSSGAVTMPAQPAFLAYHNATTSNLTNGDIIPFNTTIFDQNDDLHASSGVFTAPITGRYQFSFLVSVTQLDASATYNRILLKCSNRTVPFGITASQMFDGSGSNDPSYYAFEGSLLLDMDANDTCKLEWNQAGGANQADAFDSTYFSGYLVC